MNNVTPAQIARVKATLEGIAKETLDVHESCGDFFAYGSELACLRLFHKYNMVTNSGKTKVAYSMNLNSWYFALYTNVGK